MQEFPLANEGLPDTNRPGGLCPRCGKQSSFDIAGSLPVTFNNSLFETSRNGERKPVTVGQVSSLICRYCHQGVVVIEKMWVDDKPWEQSSGGIISFRGFHWWPLPIINLSNDIPEAIASAFKEAVMALEANCPRASAVMSRRTLEAIAVDKGETDGALAARLAALSSKGLLIQPLADWSKEVRLIGNVGAHFDSINSVSEDDAEQIISFIRELLNYFYELPAQLSRRRDGQK